MKAQLLKFLTVALLLLTGVSAKAQRVSNANECSCDLTPELPITTGALRIPQMRESERLAITAPAKGRLVFQTDGAQPGFWYNAGTRSAPIWTFLNATGGSHDHVAGTAPKPAGS